MHAPRDVKAAVRNRNGGLLPDAGLGGTTGAQWLHLATLVTVLVSVGMGIFLLLDRL